MSTMTHSADGLIHSHRMERLRKPAPSCPLDNAYAIVALLIKKPRTRRELAELLGVDKYTVVNHLRRAMAEGLVVQEKVRRKGSEGAPVFMYRWEPEVSSFHSLGATLMGVGV